MLQHKLQYFDLDVVPNGTEVGKYRAKIKIFTTRRRLFRSITKLSKSKMRKKKTPYQVMILLRI